MFRPNKPHSVVRAAAILLMLVLPAWANPPSEPISKQAAEPLTRAWSAFWSRDYEGAKNAAARVAKSDTPEARHAQHLRARALWALSERRSQANARRLWASLRGAARRDPYAAARFSIGRAAMLADQGREERAISILEKVIEQELVSVVAVEARIEMALVLGVAGEQKEALKHLDEADRLLNRSLSYGIPDGIRKAFAAAVQHARELVKTPGRAEFERAKALAEAEKYVSAIHLFNSVVERYSDTGYAARSRVELGFCYRGIGRVKMAMRAWETFIAESPSGPWRGQAYQGMMETQLRHEFDLDAAHTHAEMAVDATAAALKDNEATTSWRKVDADLAITAGTAALLKRLTKQATNHFRAASESRRISRKLRDGAKSVLANLKGEVQIIPLEITPGRSVPSLALALASVDRFLGHTERAELTVQAVLKKRHGSLSRPETAYAYYLQGRLADSRAKRDTANRLYERSLQVHAKGSWQDHARYRLAVFQDHATASQFTRVIAHLDGREPDKAELQVTRRELAAYAAAQEDLLRRWEGLIQNCPESPYLEPALRHAARIEMGTGNWRVAREHWRRYLDTFGKSPWAGEVHAALVDVELERRFDMNSTQQAIEAAVSWAKIDKADFDRLPNDVSPPDHKTIKRFRYEILLKAGLVAYLNREYETAVALLKSAQSFFTIDATFAPLRGQIPMGVSRITAAARQEKSLTPDIVLEGDRQVALMSQLATLYKASNQNRKAIAICSQVLRADAGTTTPEQMSWTYWQRAKAIYDLPKPRESRADFLLSHKTCPDAPWAPTALFQAGCVSQNFLADEVSALKYFQAVAQQYPRSDEAEPASYGSCLVLMWSNRRAEALRSFQAFLDQYPDSKYGRSIRRYRIPRLRQEMQSISNAETEGERP